MNTTVLTTVAKLKHLLSIADNQKTSATGYIHYQGGKLWATDGSAMLFFDCDPEATTEGVQPLPEGRYCLPKAEVTAAIKGCKGDLKLDLATFTDNASVRIDGCGFLKNVEYRALEIKEFKAWEAGITEAFGKNIAFRYTGQALEFSTGSDKSYTVAVSQSIEATPETAATVFRTTYATLLGKIFWNNISSIVKGKPIVFADLGSMRLVIMPLTMLRTTALDAAFERSIAAED